MKKTILLFSILFSQFFSKAQFTISTFENWHNFNVGATALTIPNGWNATDSLIVFLGLTNPGATYLTQVSKVQPGANATATGLRATTVTQPAIPGIIGGGPMPCITSNSKINVDINTGEFTFIGGTAYNANPISATFWVKNNPVNGDSTGITFLAIDDSDGGDSIVAIIDTLLGSTISNFTQITMPFITLNAGFNTKKIRVIVQSSGNFMLDATPAFTNLNDGTWIEIDEITITGPLGVSQYLMSKKELAVYPTTIENVLHVNRKIGNSDEFTFVIKDMSGKTVFQKVIQEDNNSISLQNLQSGHYIFQALKNKEIIQAGKLTKQ